MQPVGSIPQVCAWFSGDGAGSPATGARFVRTWLYVSANPFPLLVDTLAQRMRWPANVRSVWLPPDCPGLNPLARVRRDLKDDLAWQQCPDLEAQHDYVAALVQAYDTPTLHAVTAYASLVGAMNALCS